MDECIIEAENATSVTDQVMFYTLSTTPEVGLRIGLETVKCEHFHSFICILEYVVIYQLLDAWCQGDHLSGECGSVGNLTPVREMSGNWPTVRDTLVEKSYQGGLIIANFMFGATPVFCRLLCGPCIAYFKDFATRWIFSSRSIDNIWALLIVWRLGMKIIRTDLCCVVYNSCAQWYAHTCEHFLNLCWFRFRFRFCVPRIGYGVAMHRDSCVDFIVCLCVYLTFLFPFFVPYFSCLCFFSYLFIYSFQNRPILFSGRRS